LLMTRQALYPGMTPPRFCPQECAVLDAHCYPWNAATVWYGCAGDEGDHPLCLCSLRRAGHTERTVRESAPFREGAEIAGRNARAASNVPPPHSTSSPSEPIEDGSSTLPFQELVGERPIGRSPVPGETRGQHQPSLPGEPHLDWNSSPESL
jgi:hypothetical protein